MLVSRSRFAALTDINNLARVTGALVSSSSIEASLTRRIATKSYDDIPGPPSLPFFGCIRSFLPGGELNNKLGLELGEHLYSKYGPVVKLNMAFIAPSLVFLFDPDSIAEVLRGENLSPVRPGFPSLTHFRTEYTVKHDSASVTYKGTTGLITDQDEKWKTMRSTVNPVMLQPKTVKLYKNVLDDVAKDFMVLLKELRDEKNMIKENLDVEFNKWALESIGVVSLGGRLGCLDRNLAEDSPARQLIKNVHDIFKFGFELDFRPSIWRFYPTKMYKQAMKSYEKQVILSKHFIKKAVKEIEKKKVDKHEKGVLEKLLEIDENVAIIMASDMLFAGVDTAANTMLATIYLLAKNPEKQDKLRSELSNGDDKYLKAVIKESLRVMPVVSGNMRLTTKDYNINGYFIPKNTKVVFTHQYLAMRNDQYPRSSEFIPERWLAGKDDPLYYGNAHPFAMAPFGFGTRQCIGKRIAQLEFEAFLTQIMKTFKIEWDGPPINVRPVSLNYVDGPFNFVFKDL